MLFQPFKSDLILAMIKEAESHESRSHCTLIKISQVKNKHKNKYVKLNTILYIWYFNINRFPDGILIKHEAKLCSYGVMKQWGVK